MLGIFRTLKWIYFHGSGKRKPGRGASKVRLDSIGPGQKDALKPLIAGFVMAYLI